MRAYQHFKDDMLWVVEELAQGHLVERNEGHLK
jgi:hypothetical protein